MMVAAITVHWGHGLFAPKGIELPLLYSAAAFSLAVTGFGQYSLDAWLGLAGLWSDPVIWIVLIMGIAGGLGNIALRRRPATAVRT